MCVGDEGVHHASSRKVCGGCDLVPMETGGFSRGGGSFQLIGLSVRVFLIVYVLSLKHSSTSILYGSCVLPDTMNYVCSDKQV